MKNSASAWMCSVTCRLPVQQKKRKQLMETLMSMISNITYTAQQYSM